MIRIFVFSALSICLACGGGSGGATSTANQCASLADGTACGTGNVCSAGACIAACQPAQSCAPAQADPCKTSYQTSCNSTLTQSTCSATGNALDGTQCGNLQACSAGSCVASATRRVSATLQTVYLHDDGTRQIVPGWGSFVAFGASVTGLLVRDPTDPSGYHNFPVTVGADSSFSVTDVPFGPYFIQVDSFSSRFDAAAGQVEVVERVLYEATTSAPDLSMVLSQRADADSNFGTQFPTVQFNLTGLAPVKAGDSLRLFSSENLLNTNFSSITSPSTFAPPPAAGATSVRATADWGRAFGVDPDAAKGDVTWIWQRRSIPAPSGATLLNAVAFARVTDFTVQETTGGTLDAAFSPAPQSGSLPKVNWSQFAALGPSIHAGATASSFSQPFIGMEAVPQTLAFPNQPLGRMPGAPYFIEPTADAIQTEFPETFAAEATLAAPLGAATDADYTAASSGQFFDSVWHRAVQVFYSFDAPLAASPTGTFIIPDGGLYRAFVPLDQLVQPIVPLIGPPTSPQLNGQDAFAFQPAVGVQPVVSWSPPALGTATKYMLSIAPFKTFQTDEVAELTVVLYDQTQFVPPADFLKPGISYYGALSAFNSPDRLDDRILGIGSPTAFATTLFGIFKP